MKKLRKNSLSVLRRKKGDTGDTVADLEVNSKAYTKNTGIPPGIPVSPQGDTAEYGPVVPKARWNDWREFVFAMALFVFVMYVALLKPEWILAFAGFLGQFHTPIKP